MECLALSQEKNRIMRIGILSVSLPWLFGPYAQQMTILADGLLARNHTIYWISLPNAVPPELAGQNLTYREFNEARPPLPLLAILLIIRMGRCKRL